ncbi:hypothetical protein G6F65_022250 [Rhizopus arrhizus]|nr:hypothetical protein G6F65_022250 [Rhizopus arrhizus]
MPLGPSTRTRPPSACWISAVPFGGPGLCGKIRLRFEEALHRAVIGREPVARRLAVQRRVDERRRNGFGRPHGRAVRQHHDADAGGRHDPERRARAHQEGARMPHGRPPAQLGVDVEAIAVKTGTRNNVVLPRGKR